MYNIHLTCYLNVRYVNQDKIKNNNNIIYCVEIKALN